MKAMYKIVPIVAVAIILMIAAYASASSQPEEIQVESSIGSCSVPQGAPCGNPTCEATSCQYADSRVCTGSCGCR